MEKYDKWKANEMIKKIRKLINQLNKEAWDLDMYNKSFVGKE